MKLIAWLLGFFKEPPELHGPPMPSDAWWILQEIKAMPPRLLPKPTARKVAKIDEEPSKSPPAPPLAA